MAFGVNNFKSNIGALQRPALYKIDINDASNEFSFSDSGNILVKAAAVPASNIAALPVNYAGRTYKMTGFRTYDTWTTTIIADEDFTTRKSIMNWMYSISGASDGLRSANFGDASHVGDATITLLDQAGADKQSWNFVNLWPTELGEVAVDWSSDAIMEYTCTWAYDYWTHGVSQEEKKSEVSDEDQVLGDEESG